MRPSRLERALLRYPGVPDADVAKAEGVPVNHITDARLRLRDRGVVDVVVTSIGEWNSSAEIDEVRRSNRPVAGL